MIDFDRLLNELIAEVWSDVVYGVWDEDKVRGGLDMFLTQFIPTNPDSQVFTLPQNTL
jgi:hypothetical protein